MPEITNGQLRLMFQALMGLRQYEFFAIPSHRIKVAIKSIQPLAGALEETLTEISTRYGEQVEPGKFSFKAEGMTNWLAESEPLLVQTVEIPKLKGITWDDIIQAGAKISPLHSDVLEENGFLTGDPDPEPRDSLTKGATVHASV